jgi:hypothetical protein
MDEWRDVPGVPYFQVTQDGRVLAKGFTNETAVNRWGNLCPRTYKDRFLSPALGENGYLRVAALRLKNRPRFYVHRLIALAWVDGYQEGFHVNHINGVKTDNRAENLEWVTSSANVKHAWETGLCEAFGENNGQSKLSAEQVIAIREASGYGVPDAVLARIVEFSNSGIAKIVNNQTWVTHKTSSDQI